MALNIPDEDAKLPEPEPKKDGNGDSSGFGLVNWLFDHIKDRKPVFMSLYAQYDIDIKLGSSFKPIAYVMLPLCVILDLLLFFIYTIAIIAIIAGITFIFIKGTGVLDILLPPQADQVKVQQVEVQNVQNQTMKNN
jgi:hypothetical protein